MVKLDITTLIFIQIFAMLALLFGAWIFSSYRRINVAERQDTESIWKCGVCLTNYIDSRHDELSVCPLCGSYNAKDTAQKKS